MATGLLTPGRHAPSLQSPPHSHRPGSELIGLLALVAIAVGVPVGAAAATGAFDIPRLDDFAYARAAIDLHRTGHVHLVGWGEMMLVGHLLWGVPFLAAFGDSIAAAHAAAATAAALGLLATYLLARQFLPARRALLLTAVVGAYPSYAVLTPVYMTDLTSYLAEVSCLALGTAALRAETHRAAATLLGLSLLVGLWGFTVRESAIAAPAAVLAGHAALARRSPRSPGAVTLRALALAALSLTVAAATAYAWRNSLPNDQQVHSRPGTFDRIKALAAEVNSYYTMALALSPLLVLGIRQRLALLRASPAARMAFLLVGAVGLAALLITHYPARTSFTVLLGGQLTRDGLPMNLRGTPDLFSAPLWVALNSAAVLAGALLAGAVVAAALDGRTLDRGTLDLGHPTGEVAGGPRPGARQWARRLRDTPPALVLLVAYGAGSATLLILRTIGGYGLFGRYLIGLVLVLGIVVLRQTSPRQASPGRLRVLLAPATAFTAVALLSWVLMLEGDAFDAARWSLAEQVQASGVPATQIAAGFDWVGDHIRRPIRLSDEITNSNGRCVQLTGAPDSAAGLQLLGTRTYALFDRVLERHMWAYRYPPLCPSVARG